MRALCIDTPDKAVTIVKDLEIVGWYFQKYYTPCSLVKSICCLLTNLFFFFFSTFQTALKHSFPGLKYLTHKAQKVSSTKPVCKLIIWLTLYVMLTKRSTSFWFFSFDGIGLGRWCKKRNFEVRIFPTCLCKKHQFTHIS